MTHPVDQANRRILVVDDNDAIHDDFRKILSEPNRNDRLDALRADLLGDPITSPHAVSRYEVNSSFQGEEALEQVLAARTRGEPYALAFVDMRMPPGWDGLQTAQRLFEADPEIQIVICTAYSDYSWESIHHDLGVTDRLLLLKKPFDCAEVAQLASALTVKWNDSRLAHLKLSDLERMVTLRTGELEQANAELQQQVLQREKAEEQLRHFAYHDPLTRLPNRMLLAARLHRCMERVERKQTPGFAVCFLDLDNFKLINDSMGHGAGDELLLQVARRLSTSLRVLDTVSRDVQATPARLGGDEFVILLEGVGAAHDAVRIAQRVQRILSEPFAVLSKSVTISGSIGIRLGDANDTSAEVILRDADVAMYRAKQAGSGRYALFDSAMQQTAILRLDLENRLRLAVESRSFQLAFQPIVSLHDGLIHSFEALLRWPDAGTAPLDEAIRVAEETGLIIPLGTWVLEQACRQAQRWNERHAGVKPIAVGVNVSKCQLADDDFFGAVQSILDQTGVRPQCLHLEVTESTVIQSTPGVLEMLRSLKRLGVGLHMDDFGTGYSSLACLHQIPFDFIKIDRSFISSGAMNRECMAIVHAVIGLAKNLNMKVIAEGVETSEDLAALVALDCDFAQGYYFSKAVGFDAAWQLLSSGGPWAPVAEETMA